jgi:hypothetical protein
MCELFRQQTVHLCTKSCASNADCPAPTAQTCTPNSWCKCN